MGKYRKILVAIDGSDISLHALRESLKFAKAEGCSVIVLSVIPRYEGDLGAAWLDNIRESMKKPCALALSEAEKIAKQAGVTIRTVCEEGEIFERIVDFADAENCNLIVMGRKGMSRLERTFVGSVTARVIGHAHEDILVIPEGAAFGSKRVLLATDGSKYSDIATERAIDFARSHESVLYVVSVVNVPPEFYSYAKALETADDLIKNARKYVELVKEKSEAQGVETVTVVKDGEPSKIIIDLSTEHHVDIIVVGSHGRTGLRRLLMGSNTEKVIGQATRPVLVTRT